MTEAQRKIIHVDMDCFFAAVEEREDPSLRSIPVAVGGSPERRGVVCTANYPARKFGVRSAMASGYAKKLCPHLTILPVRIALYRGASQKVFDIFTDYSELIQPISLDEAFLDVSHATACKGSATLIAQEIRWRIQSEVGLTASAGVAPNKFIAKIASDWEKPNGLCVVTPDQVDTFARQLPVEKIWGVGKVTAQRLHNIGCQTCDDIRQVSPAELIRQFGSFGHTLRELSFGRDERPVSNSGQRKSLSVENTYPDDLDHDQCAQHIRELREQMSIRLHKFLARRPEHRIKGITVKIKFSDFRSTTIDSSTGDLNEDSFLTLLAQGLTRSDLPVRLLGCGVRFHDPKDANPRQLDFLHILDGSSEDEEV